MMLPESLTQPKLLDNTTLIAQLAAHEVRHLRAVTTAPPTVPLPPEQLIYLLAQHPEPRLRESLITLFLRHPEYHHCVPAAANSLDKDAAEVLHHMYTAAVYLQRFWYSTLQLYLGPFPTLPDYFGQKRFTLPAPAEHFGEAGLRALAAHFQQQTGHDWLTVYESAITLFLTQLEFEVVLS